MRAGSWREKQRRVAGVERLIAQLLLWGGLLSAILVLFGVGLYAARGGFQGPVSELQRLTRPERASHPTDVFVSLPEVLHGLAARPVNPLAVIALGQVLLLMTPVLAVAAAIPAFLRDGDGRYAAVAGIVLSMLLASLLLAGVAR